METNINDSFSFDEITNSIKFIGHEDDSWTITQFLGWCQNVIESDINRPSVGSVHVRGFYLDDAYNIDEEVPKHLRSVEQKFYMIHRKASGEDQVREEYDLEGK